MSVPRGWIVKPLNQLAETALGKMLDRGKNQGLARVPYLRNVNVQWDSIDTRDLLTMELAEEERERFGVRTGDLLICEGGEVGRAAIWNGRDEYLAYQKALHRIRSRGDLDLKFLRYLLEHYRHNGTLARYSTGSTIAHLPQQKLQVLPVPHPPLLEQARIVEILEGHLSRLDAGKAILDDARRRLRVLQAAALDETRDGVAVRLAELATIQGGVQKQPTRMPRANSYSFLRVANVTKYGLELDNVHEIELFAGELERLRLQQGDLLVVEGNGSPAQIGRAALWNGSIADCVHQNHLIRVRPNERLLPEYLEAVWNSPGNRRQLTVLASSSSGLHTLSVSKLKSIMIPAPPLRRQRELVERVKYFRHRSSRLNEAVTLSTAKIAGLRRALLQDAFAGRLLRAPRTVETTEEMAGV